MKISSSELSFCPILKNESQKFFESTKTFNSENIVQVSLVSSKTYKVNRISAIHERVPTCHFLCGAINDNSECFPKDDFS